MMRLTPDPSPAFATTRMRLATALQHGLAVLVGSLLLLWPAMINGYVLLNPDSIGYLSYGPMIARALLSPRTHPPFEARAEFYCLLIDLLRGGLDPWPVIVLQALVLSYVLWLVVRSIARSRPVATFLVMMAVLSVCTGLSWQVSWVMTDILGGAAYLCLYLLVFTWDDLSVAERWVVAAIAWWCVTAHLTHLLLAGAAFALLAMLLIVRWDSLRRFRVPMAAAGGVLVFCVGSLMAMHAYLYGVPSVGGYHPPYLMARVIADGPGRWYLQQHCPVAGLVICREVDRLPASSNDILWLQDSVWMQSTGAERALIGQQEMPFVLAAVRAYPGAELRQAMRNFLLQAHAFGFRVFVTSAWMEGMMDAVTPGSRALYMQSRQAHNAMPTRLADRVQRLLLLLSRVLLVLFVPVAVLRWRVRVLGLALIALPAVVENAFVCGVLSNVDDRLQNRVMWLVPLVALLLVVDRFGGANGTSSRMA